jgi:phosphoglycerol transferase MdoB-like AlkP superfamily enzyme
MYRKPGQLSPSVVFVSLAVSLCGLAYYIWRFEAYRHNVVYVCSTTLLIMSTIVLVTRRALLAVLLVTAAVALIRAVAIQKHRKMNMTLHAYDVMFYLSSWPTITFLWSHFRVHFLAFVVAVSTIVVTAVIIFRFDPTRVRRRYSLCAALLFGFVAYTSAPARVEAHYWEYFLDNRSLTSFYSSWRDVAHLLWRGYIFEAAERSLSGPFGQPHECHPQSNAPNIILIHHESMVPPSRFLNESVYDASLERLFRSHDGKIHNMRVETYGGASWLTEFSVMTGLSTYSFGSMRPFVQSMIAGNVRATLPQSLLQCGYHGSVFYPAQRTFGSSETFYKSIGVADFFDLNDQEAPTLQERDKFYYDNALSYMSEHFRTLEQRLFTFIITMAGHQPYNSPYMPDFEPRGNSPDLDPEVNEWLRRVAMVNEDYIYLKEEVSKRFPEEPFLFVHYGDHQPIVTRPYVTFDGQKSESRADASSYTTYFAIEGLNYTPPELPEFDNLDVAYLGLMIMKATNVPLTDVYRERERLMHLCEGRYYDCPSRDAILDFHRRLIDSGLVTMPR